MNLIEIHVPNVVCAVVVVDLSAGPFETLDAKFVTRIDTNDRRNIWVPTVVERHWLIVRWLFDIDLDLRLWHDSRYQCPITVL